MGYELDIINAAQRYGVPTDLALSVADQESGIRQYDSTGAVIRGTSGEYGIFQLMPGTASELGVDPTDPRQNIDGGVRYLSKMYSMTGSWPDALMAYNGGIGNWQGGTVSTAARNYSQEVLARTGQTVTARAPEPITGPVFDWGWSWAGGTDQAALTPPVFTAEATAQRPRTELLVVLGLLAAVVVSQHV